MKLHVSVSNSHKLFIPLLKVTGSLIFGDREDFQTGIQERPREFLGSLMKHIVTGTSFYESINQHIRPICDLGSIVEVATAGVSKMFVDIVVCVFFVNLHRLLCQTR
jgi:hypothetical protein